MAEPRIACPLPYSDGTVRMGHGGGGQMTRDLIDRVFARRLADPHLDVEHDAALLELPSRRLAFTTDAFVVHPLQFAGGSIGSLAVFGTVNDLCTRGARPAFLSAGFVLEEGLPIATLEAVVDSMREAALASGVHVVAGDTKVVERGKADGLYITTSGIGVVPQGLALGPGGVREGDAILVSGDVGRHGLAILSAREGLGFDEPIESDCAAIVDPVFDLLDSGIEVHCLRDPTRGGLATALIEIATATQLEVEIDAHQVPVRADVRAASDVLGLDPLYLACEGRFVAFVDGGHAGRALEILRGRDPLSRVVGRVCKSGTPGQARIRTEIGTLRVLDLRSWDALPRIC